MYAHRYCVDELVSCSDNWKGRQAASGRGRLDLRAPSEDTRVLADELAGTFRRDINPFRRIINVDH